MAPTVEIPTDVVLAREDLTNPRFTPGELEAVQARYGRSFSALVVDDASDDKLTVLAWLKLRRLGHQIDLEAMRDVVICVRPGDSALDPSNGAG